jgi:hypothetical protein
MSVNGSLNFGNMFVQEPQQSEGYKFIPINISQTSCSQFELIQCPASGFLWRADLADLIANHVTIFRNRESWPAGESQFRLSLMMSYHEGKWRRTSISSDLFPSIRTEHVFWTTPNIHSNREQFAQELLNYSDQLTVQFCPGARNWQNRHTNITSRNGQTQSGSESRTEFHWYDDVLCCVHIGCPTSSVAQANLTIKTNFNILRSFSPSDILTIYLHAFLQSRHPFEKNCVQDLPRDFRQNSRIRTRN